LNWPRLHQLAGNEQAGGEQHAEQEEPGLRAAAKLFERYKFRLALPDQMSFPA